MDRQENPTLGWLPAALRRLERKLGADREGRTLWVWIVPALTFVVTFLVLAFLGVQGNVDWALTVPMALTLSLFLSSLSAFYLTAASSDERDSEDDGPDDRRRPPSTPDRPHPPDTAEPVVVHVPHQPAPATEQRTPVGSGASRR